MTDPVFKFRPKARIMELLGEQLIKNHTLALFELVKNSYDADADSVDVYLKDINSNDSSIEVIDNGYGMSFDTVTNIWLEPAHNHKSISRKNKEKTKKGRLPVGEKGVGRFAVHRLGSKITMITRAAGKKEVVVDIDWEVFLKNDYLDQAEISVLKRRPVVFKGNETGTKIIISRLKQNWTRGDVRKIYRQMNSMTKPILPLSEVSQEIKDGFIVKLNVTPELNWLDGLFSADMAYEQSLFRFQFSMTNDGLSYKYDFVPYKAMQADYPSVIEERSVIVDGLKSNDFFKYFPTDNGEFKTKNKRKATPKLVGLEEAIGIGEIHGEILGYDFDPDIFSRYLKDSNDGLSNYVKDQGGVRIYRDGLRVYNYGEPGDDWLNLDHRRIQAPTKKLGSRQVIGSIKLNLNDSHNLIEKTNREGFVENSAYDELKHAVICSLIHFEAERNKDKKLLKDVLKLSPGSSKDKINNRGLSTDELLEDLHLKILSDKSYIKLEPIVKEVTKAYAETRDALMSAAGAGMGLVTVFHELERGVRGLHNAILEGVSTQDLKSISDEIVSLLRGAMYMVNTKEMETINASRLVEFALLTQGRRLRKHGITLLNGLEDGKAKDFPITGIRRMLTTSLVNLIDNAIYWADGEDECQKYIWIGLSHELEGPAIVITDSGPGFIDKAHEVVQPFFTRKPSGMGIGLYYVDMVMKSHGGRLSFPDADSVERPAVVNGACVALVFKD